MARVIGSSALLARDHDEAIAFYTQAVGFELIEDTPLGGGKRWVRVAPPGGGTALLLAKAVTPEQLARSATRPAAGSSRSPTPATSTGTAGP
jgi:catechol 2,3-dioxygenase-like lactoylglutathione lyase family enzyme